MNRKTIYVVAYFATVLLILSVVRWYVHWYVLPAALQSARIEDVKAEKLLIDYLDQRYSRSDAIEYDNPNAKGGL